MSTISTASISSTDPGKTSDASSVTKTSTAARGDTLTVDAFQEGSDGKGNAVVVLKIGSDGRATVSKDASGNWVITGTGGSSVQYVSIVLGSSDPTNWDVSIGTSGGSTYRFRRGGGGGGH